VVSKWWLEKDHLGITLMDLDPHAKCGSGSGKAKIWKKLFDV
jgi:hypothetical protein